MKKSYEKPVLNVVEIQLTENITTEYDPDFAGDGYNVFTFGLLKNGS